MDTNIFNFLKEHRKLFVLLSVLAYPLGFLRKDKYLELLSVDYSSKDIFTNIDYYKAGIYFLVPALSLPALFMLIGSLIYHFFGQRLNKYVLLVSTFISVIVYDCFLYFHKLVIHEVITNSSYMKVLYTFPLPITDSYYEGIPLLFASLILPITFIFRGFQIRKNIGKLVFYDWNFVGLLILWIGALIYSQNTELNLKVSMGSDSKVFNSFNEISYAYLKTNKEIIYSDSIEDKYYHTKVAMINSNENFYYAVAINPYKNENKSKQYTFVIIPRDIIKETSSITEYEHLMGYSIRKKQEEGRIRYLLSLLKNEKYKVLNDINILSLGGEKDYFHYIVIGRKVIFNILTSHYNGNLAANDAGNIYIDRDGNIEGITFYSVLEMEKRKQILAQFGVPVINLIVLTNEKATITNAEKYPINIVKYDNLNRFIEAYDGNPCTDINEIAEKINALSIVN